MIRPYKRTDTNELIEIFKLNTPEYFNINEIVDFKEYLEKNHKTYLTVELNDIIVGGTGYYLNEKNKTGQITWIFFDPNYSGKGLGKQSVEYCLKILQANEKVEKTVVTTSQLAFKFFEKFGFKTIRIEKDYWAKGLDLFEMEMINNKTSC